MPTDIKKAASALICSCIATLIAVYFVGLDFEGAGFNDPLTLAFNIAWTLVVASIIADLYRGVDIKMTLELIGAITLCFLIWDSLDFGFGISQFFYALELFMYVVTYFLVTSPESAAWYSTKNLS